MELSENEDENKLKGSKEIYLIDTKEVVELPNIATKMITKVR